MTHIPYYMSGAVRIANTQQLSDFSKSVCVMFRGVYCIFTLYEHIKDNEDAVPYVVYRLQIDKLHEIDVV